MFSADLVLSIRFLLFLENSSWFSRIVVESCEINTVGAIMQKQNQWHGFCEENFRRRRRNLSDRNEAVDAYSDSSESMDSLKYTSPQAI